MTVTGTPPIARAESICEEILERNTNSPTFPLNAARRRSSDWQCIAVPTSSKRWKLFFKIIFNICNRE